MEKTLVTLRGRIWFDPSNKTNKHNNQASWKVVAMVTIEGEHCEYYSWFVQKRYNVELNKPLRGAHVTFINDRVEDIAGKSPTERAALWEEVKKKWNGKPIEVVYDTDIRTDGKHWWFNIPEELRQDFHSIRAELGLGRPYYGLHMTVGFANERNIQHSQYIHDCIIREKLI